MSMASAPRVVTLSDACQTDELRSDALSVSLQARWAGGWAGGRAGGWASGRVWGIGVHDSVTHGHMHNSLHRRPRRKHDCLQVHVCVHDQHGSGVSRAQLLIVSAVPNGNLEVGGEGGRQPGE